MNDDADGDGWDVCAGDCDDGNPDAYPGAPATPAEDLGETVKPLVALHTGLPVRTGVARDVSFRGELYGGPAHAPTRPEERRVG